MLETVKTIPQKPIIPINSVTIFKIGNPKGY